MPFKTLLRQWRGPHTPQKAAWLLQVPLDTYQSWEVGESEPAVKEQVLREIVAKRIDTQIPQRNVWGY